MKLFSIFVAACAFSGGVAAARAEAPHISPEPVFVAPGMTPMVATMQARAAQRAADLKRAWLAAGNPANSSEPTISSGKILTSTVDVQTAPAAPAFSVTFKTGTAGLNSIVAYFYPSSTGQYFGESYGLPYQAKGPTKGTITVQSGRLSLYAPPGTWTLYYLYIYDQAGNATYYGASQLAALFPSLTFTVTNAGTPDSTAPTLSAGTILTPKVSRSSAHPTFNTSLTVADDLSGVDWTVVYLTPPGGNSGCGYVNDPPSPILSGTVTNYDSLACFGSPAPTGTWSIDGYEICDVAGNCLYDTTPADVKAIFGKTTFKVTD